MRKYDDIKGAIWRVIGRLKRPNEDVDELFNEIWCCGNIHTCKQKHLFQAITWALYDYRAKQAKRRFVCYGDKAIPEQAYITDYAEQLDIKDMLVTMYEMLTKKQKPVISLYLEGYPLSKVAKILETSKQNTYKHYDNAIQMMRSHYKVSGHRQKYQL